MPDAAPAKTTSTDQNRSVVLRRVALKMVDCGALDSEHEVGVLLKLFDSNDYLVNAAIDLYMADDDEGELIDTLSRVVHRCA